MIYISASGIDAQVNLQILNGERVQANWFDPRTGETTPIGNYWRHDAPTFSVVWDGPDQVVLIDRLETDVQG